MIKVCPVFVQMTGLENPLAQPLWFSCTGACYTGRPRPLKKGLANPI
jgi:hypothetical protein